MVNLANFLYKDFLVSLYNQIEIDPYCGFNVIVQ